MFSCALLQRADALFHVASSGTFAFFLFLGSRLLQSWRESRSSKMLQVMPSSCSRSENENGLETPIAVGIQSPRCHRFAAPYNPYYRGRRHPDRRRDDG